MKEGGGEEGERERERALGLLLFSSTSLDIEVAPGCDETNALLACAGRDAVLCSDQVSGRTEQQPEHAYHPIVRLCCT